MNKTHIFSGHAQLPEGTDIYVNYKYVSVLVEVDMTTGKAVNCEVPVFCNESSDFVAKIIKGKSLDNDMEKIIEEIEERMHTLSKRALITAIQTVYNRYSIVKKRVDEKLGLSLS